MEENVNIQPGDRIIPPKLQDLTGRHGICQWVDYSKGEISVFFSDGGYGVYPIHEVTPVIKRVLKSPDDMTMEELKEEITLLRESRLLSVEISRQRKTEGKKSTPPPVALPPGEDPRDAKIPKHIREGSSPAELELLRKMVGK